MRDFLFKGNKGRENAAAVTPPLIFLEAVDDDEVVKELENFEDCPRFV